MVRRELNVLIIEDSEDDAQLILRELKQGGYTFSYERVETKPDMQVALSSRQWDIILSDFSMPHFSAMGALDTLKASGLDIPFIVISGTIGEETAVSALKGGANDFLVKSKLVRLPEDALEKGVTRAMFSLEYGIRKYRFEIEWTENLIQVLKHALKK